MDMRVGVMESSEAGVFVVQLVMILPSPLVLGLVWLPLKQCNATHT